MYPAERGCVGVVWPFATHPTNKNEVIVWDLAEDPAELMSLDTAALRERLFTRAADLEARGLKRLPVKTIHINKSPVVIGKLQTLSPAMAERWGIDLAAADRHAQTAARITGEMAGVWPGVFAREAPPAVPDVDEDLYGGFVGNDDRRLLNRLRQLAPPALAKQVAEGRVAFNDPRLEELLFRYRARNFPASLDEAESERWMALRAARLHEGVGGGFTLAAYMERIDALAEAAAERGDERAEGLLEALVDYAETIAPER
jgi:exodeoxyribonuclease-1